MPKKAPPRRVGRPPGADPERTQAALLDAALQAFADGGFDGASIRDVTGAVGVGHNLVRHYFGSKADLWRAAMHHGLDDVSRRLTEVMLQGSDRPAAETMRGAVDLLVEQVGVNPAAVRVLVAEAVRGGPRFDYLFDNFIAPVGVALIQYLDGPTQAPSAIDLRVVGLFAFSAVFGTVAFDGLIDRLGLALPSADGQGDDLARQLTELVLHGMLARP